MKQYALRFDGSWTALEIDPAAGMWPNVIGSGSLDSCVNAIRMYSGKGIVVLPVMLFDYGAELTGLARLNSPT